jgi:hypothetical protein
MVNDSGAPVTSCNGEMVDEERRDEGKPMASAACSNACWNGEGRRPECLRRRGAWDLLTGVLCCTKWMGKGIRGCGNREEGMGKLMEAWGSLYPTNSSLVAGIGAEL